MESLFTKTQHCWFHLNDIKNNFFLTVKILNSLSHYQQALLEESTSGQYISASLFQLNITYDGS